MYLEITHKNTKQQQVAYNSQQWNYFNKLIMEIFKGSYGEHYDFLLAELTEGPYWPLVKARLGQPQEYNPDKSVSGSRDPRPEDDSSSSSLESED